MRLILPAILLLLCLAPARGQGSVRTWVDKQYDPQTRTSLTVTALVGTVPPSGYMPFRVRIFNGYPVPRTWSFEFRSSDEDLLGDGSELRSDFSVPCEAASSTEIDLLVPLVTGFSDGDRSVSLELAASATALPTLRESRQSDYMVQWPAVLISDDLDTANRGTLSAALNSALSYGPSHFGASTLNLEFGASFAAETLPEDWRGFSGFDTCMISEREWRDLLPGARNALLKWNRLGGAILIYSPARSDLAALGIPGAESGSRTLDRSWGEVRALDVPSNLQLEGPDATVDLIRSDLSDASGGGRQRVLYEDFSSMWPLQTSFGEKTTNILFFILVLIVFGILVGPVNLFVFAKAGRRHRLFITTPLISLGASLLLIILIIFQDGFGGRGLRVVLMEVQPGPSENSAYISQEQIARTGVLLNTEFKTGETGLLSPVLIEESRWARITQDNEGGQARYTVDLEEDGMRLAGSWFQSRSEHGHLFETIVPTRGRISLVQESPAPVITSTFEFPLAELWYRDPAGELWRAEGVTQGRNVTLSPSVDPGAFDRWINGESIRFVTRNQKRLQKGRTRRDHFFATTEEAEGIPTLHSINWQGTRTMITGPVSR